MYIARYAKYPTADDLGIEDHIRPIVIQIRVAARAERDV
jgi:hypothetical protein